MKSVLVLLIATACLASVSYSQRPTATPPVESDESVVKVSTDLIQIDVTVTDKKGKVVTGLRPEDFEIFENGEKQKIASFSFVARTVGSASAAGEVMNSPPQSSSQDSRGKASSSLTPRTIAIVVDDLNLSFVSINLARKALLEFVEKQMLPDDRVAIIRTAGGAGSLQQFTSDKQSLRNAIAAIRWNPSSGSFDTLTSLGQTASDITDRFRRESDLVAGGNSKTTTVVLDRDFGHDRKSADVAKNSGSQESGIYAQTSLGTVRYVISGMSKLPGRKTMFLFSDGIDVGSGPNKGRSTTVLDYLEDAADLANKSSVTIYTFDTKGMRSFAAAASDNTYEIIDGHREQKMLERRSDFKDSQDGLVHLASLTGGRAVLNTDNLNGGIDRALDEQSGYYLLAYVPDTEEFNAARRRFNKLEVLVTRPDLRVSHRSGFFVGGPNEALSGLSADSQLSRALLSPFSQNDIGLNMNVLFANDKSGGSYLRSLLHIDARGLKFDDVSGWKNSKFDILAVAFDEKGSVAESKQVQYTIKTRGATYETMLARGFVYVLPISLKKPGRYQLRLAIRDAETGRMGSAFQFIEVPDVTNDRLVISSPAVEDVDLQTWSGIQSGKIGNSKGQSPVPSTLLYDTILQQFKPGTILRYGYEIYNAAVATSGLPDVEAKASIFRENTPVVDGHFYEIKPSKQSDLKRIKVSGALTLPSSLEPGEYVLRLAVVDQAGKQTATQIVPFEIVQ